MRAVRFFVGIVLGLTITAVAAYGQAINFRRVTDGVLQDPPDSDWLQWRRTYDGWAYSPLDQIDRDNVGDLQLAWSRALNPGIVQLIPLVHDGVMYIPHPGGIVEAVDATDDDLIWRYRRARPGGVERPATITREYRDLRRQDLLRGAFRRFPGRARRTDRFGRLGDPGTRPRKGPGRPLGWTHSGQGKSAHWPIMPTRWHTGRVLHCRSRRGHR